MLCIQLETYLSNVAAVAHTVLYMERTSWPFSWTHRGCSPRSRDVVRELKLELELEHTERA